VNSYSRIPSEAQIRTYFVFHFGAQALECMEYIKYFPNSKCRECRCARPSGVLYEAGTGDGDGDVACGPGALNWSSARWSLRTCLLFAAARGATRCLEPSAGHECGSQLACVGGSNELFWIWSVGTDRRPDPGSCCAWKVPR
jgi:hypothetical protein